MGRFRYTKESEMKTCSKESNFDGASPNLQINVHGIDGSTRMFIQNEPNLVSRTLDELNPTRIFTQDRITIADEHSEAAFFPPLVTRIDLITDRLSVWDFPFQIGALVELTEMEFRERLQAPQRLEGPRPRDSYSVYLDIEMVNSRHAFLRIEIIAGLPMGRLLNIYSLFKERRLIVGLPAGGIGVLNLANMVRFQVHPDPQKAGIVAESLRQPVARQRPSLTESRNHQRSGNEKTRTVHSPRDYASIELREQEQ